MRQDQLDPIVRAIVEESIRPAITATIEEIRNEVQRRTNGMYRPSASVVKYSLNRIGIETEPKKRKWVKKIKGGESSE